MFFEDVIVGSTSRLGSFTFTEENILAFARIYDPQPFHIDKRAAEASPYGGLIASGWQVAAIWMKLNVAYLQAVAAAAIEKGEPVGRLGPSPGFRNMVWARPVRPGDTIAYVTTIAGKKESGSRPGWGIVSIDNEGTTQTGERAFAFEGAVFWERRPIPT